MVASKRLEFTVMVMNGVAATKLLPAIAVLL